MRLIDLLTEDTIVPSLQATTKEQVIDELVDQLVSKGYLEAAHAEEARAAIRTRESSQTTGLGGGVAIPHGLCGGVEDVLGALGVSQAGIDFAAIDGAPVHLVILLVVPQNRFQAHIRTLAGIARVLNDSRLRQEIVAAGSASAIMEILVNREEAAV